jgi:NAD-dependent dihydropyrimidine dehydrogenase PreA subunit
MFISEVEGLMRSISNIWDVVDWGLCIGCGACAYACDRNAVTLKNIEAIGIRPFFERQACRGCAQCLEFCPGYCVVVGTVERAQPNEESYRFLIGSAIEIWEGAATVEKFASAFHQAVPSVHWLFTVLRRRIWSLYCIRE